MAGHPLHRLMWKELLGIVGRRTNASQVTLNRLIPVSRTDLKIGTSERSVPLPIASGGTVFSESKTTLLLRCYVSAPILQSASKFVQLPQQLSPHCPPSLFQRLARLCDGLGQAV